VSHYLTTPLHGSQTPSYAAFGSRTPVIVNQTPMHDGSRHTSLWKYGLKRKNSK
jgi:hypothetical protein